MRLECIGYIDNPLHLGKSLTAEAMSECTCTRTIGRETQLTVACRRLTQWVSRWTSLLSVLTWSRSTEPLYTIGAGDLGTSASKIDQSLASILKVSASWTAVVLIDEADVFLEERTLQHIERNAMVAVFLRHLE